MSERVPVHDPEAEAAVLSALMLDPERVAAVEGIVGPRDFYADRTRWVAEAIWALDGAAETVDIITIATWLRAKDRLAQVGGAQYLAQLTDATPHVAHVEDHARIVATAARIRRVGAVCRSLLAEAPTALADGSEWLLGAERRILEAADWSSMGRETIAVLRDALAEEHAALTERAASDGKITGGARTRIPAVDRILNGLVDGVAYIVAARPGVGKTAFGWQVAEGVSRTAMVAFLSQEMPRAQLVQRALAQAANLEPDVIRSGQLTPEQWRAVADGAALIQHLPIAIDDRSGHTEQSARSAVRRCIHRLHAAGHTGRLGLVVLDYLQIMRDARRDGDSRATSVGENMHAMTRLAKEFSCPVLVLAQLNRENTKRPNKRPQLSDLGESGAIEQDAYGVIFVHREDVYREESAHDGMAEIIVAKHRNGRTGSAMLRYLPSTLFAGVADEFDGNFDDPTEGRYG